VDVSYSGLSGAGYYGVQDTDGATTPVDAITLDVTGVNITNYDTLELSFLLAEDDATDGNEDWDSTASFRVAVQIDGGGFVDVFAVESEENPSTPGDFTNEAPRVDTDFDGVGDGTPLTDAFTAFTVGIAGTGSLLDLRVTIEDLNAGDEDIALDDLRLTGHPIPEPASLALLGLAGVTLLGRSRR